MCKVESSSVEQLLLSAIQSQVGVQALSAFQSLQEGGVCLAHFCAGVQALSSQGQIRSSDPSHPLVSGMPPGKILELGLVTEGNPGQPTVSSKEVRILAQSFKVFMDQPLGRGSFGVVYRGEQIRLQRPVAIKILRLKSLPADVPGNWFLERFRREPSVIARLNHPHIVQVIDCGEEPEELWYAMEYLPGGTLMERIRREGRLSPADVRKYLRAMADALDVASRNGVLHRDVKPGNVFNSGPKLADFGLAKVPPSRGEGGIPGMNTPRAAIVGSPPYVAPERANFQSGDLRSDVYSLGATMYHAASGKNLFDLDPHDRQAWYRCHLQKEPEPLLNRVPDLPKDLAAIIHRCLAKSPGDRYRSFEAIVDALGKG